MKALKRLVKILACTLAFAACFGASLCGAAEDNNEMACSPDSVASSRKGQKLICCPKETPYLTERGACTGDIAMASPSLTNPELLNPSSLSVLSSGGQEEARAEGSWLNGAEDVREMTVKEYVLAKLREAHRRGEYLELAEEDFMKLSDAEIRAMIQAEKDIEEFERKKESEGVEAYIPDAKETEKNFFESCLDKIKENKAAAAACAIGATGFAGGFAYAYQKNREFEIEQGEAETRRREKRIAKKLALINHDQLAKDGICKYIQYMDLDDHDLIMAEGAARESLIPASQAVRLSTATMGYWNSAIEPITQDIVAGLEKEGMSEEEASEKIRIVAEKNGKSFEGTISEEGKKLAQYCCSVESEFRGICKSDLECKGVEKQLESQKKANDKIVEIMKDRENYRTQARLCDELYESDYRDAPQVTPYGEKRFPSCTGGECEENESDTQPPQKPNKRCSIRVG